MNNIGPGKNIAIVGFGYCGCSMVDKAVESIKEQEIMINDYVPYFVDCSYNFGDVKKNQYDDNSFFTLTSGGTAQDRERAKKAIEENINTKQFIYRNFSVRKYDSVYLIGSSEGGIGSVGVIEFAKRIRKINNEIEINLVVLVPEFDNVGLRNGKNTFELNKEIKTELEKYEEKSAISSIMYVINKKNNKHIFDKSIMTLLVKSIEIDTLYKINMDKNQVSAGYKIILSIDKGYKDFNEAIEEAISESSIVLPDEFFDNEKNKFLKPKEKVHFQKAIALFNHNLYDVSISKVLSIVMPRQQFNFSVNANKDNLIIAEGYYNKSNKILPTKFLEFYKDECMKILQDKDDYNYYSLLSERELLDYMKQ